MGPPRLAVWPTLPPNVHLRGRSDLRPFPLDRRECRLFSRARHGLWSGVRALGLERGDEVMAPAYHHGSEIEALVRCGLRIRYYDVTDSLEPDAAAVDRLFRSGVRVFYLIHYLGFPQDAARWRVWCHERQIMLFEDAAQGWLASREGMPIGSSGDLAIFCLYKTVGVPDGAALISRFPPPPPASRPTTGLYGLSKRHGAWLSQRGGILATTLTQLSNVTVGMERSAQGSVGEFALGDPDSPPSSTTTYVLPRILDAKIAERRRDNYRFLLDMLGDLVPPPLVDLPHGACPFAFPIGSDIGPRLVDDLETWGVKALLFWRYPHPSLDVDRFPVAKGLRDTLVALPVHQELTQDDLRRIANAVKSVIQ